MIALMNQILMMQEKTKIVCTIGPSVNSYEKLEALVDAGMNVARLNFSHSSHEHHLETINLLKEIRQKKQRPLAILLDTKGPEIRLGTVKQQFQVQKQEQFYFIKQQIEGSKEEGLFIDPPMALDYVQKDSLIYIADGHIMTKVIKVEKERVLVEVMHGGMISSRKGINIPGCQIDLPELTEKDREDILFGAHNDVDYIAASFVRSPSQIAQIRDIVEEAGKTEIQIIAKIENHKGVENFESILDIADGIMIARGDLGIELPLSQVPKLQKMMTRQCYQTGKLSVIATQMLDSMVCNPRPTRAEASDVANAIYDCTTAVMLSDETAVGQYPVEAVDMMRLIIKESEGDVDYFDFFKYLSHQPFKDVPSAVARSCIDTAYAVNATAIFAYTTTGTTARMLAKMRPQMPILAMTPNEKVFHQMALCWGTIPILNQEPKDIESAKIALAKYALDHGLAKEGDLVAVISGTPFGEPGSTNMIVVYCIGEIAIKGEEGEGSKVSGQVAIFNSFYHAKPYALKGCIVVLTDCEPSYEPILKHAKGLILDHAIEDEVSLNSFKKIARNLNLPYLMGAHGASEGLREGLFITLDPKNRRIDQGIKS